MAMPTAEPEVHRGLTSSARVRQHQGKSANGPETILVYYQKVQAPLNKRLERRKEKVTDRIEI